MNNDLLSYFIMEDTILTNFIQFMGCALISWLIGTGASRSAVVGMGIAFVVGVIGAYLL